MTDTEILDRVKNALGLIGTDSQNSTILQHIEDVKAEMSIAGVSDEVLKSPLAVGCIVQGVIDEWGLTPGQNAHSEMYKTKLTALVSESMRKAASDD